MDFHLTWTQIALALAAMLMGGFAKGVTGLGLPTILTPTLAAIFGIRVAVPMVAISTVTLNLLVIGRYKSAWREVWPVWPMVAAGLVTTTLGAMVLRKGDPGLMAILLASLSLGYVLLNLTGRRISIPPGKQNLYGPLVGLVAGFFQGTTGVCAPLVLAYLAGIRGFTRQGYFFALSLVFLLLALNQVIGYLLYGLYTVSVALTGAAAALPVIAAFYTGIWLQERLDADKMRQATLAVIFLSALKLLWNNL